MEPWPRMMVPWFHYVPLYLTMVLWWFTTIFNYGERWLETWSETASVRMLACSALDMALLACNRCNDLTCNLRSALCEKKASACGMNCFTFRLLRGMDGTLFSGPETSWNNQQILKRSKELSVISVPTPILSGSLCRQQDAAQLHLWHRMSTSTPAQYCNIEPPQHVGNNNTFKLPLIVITENPPFILEVQ